MGVLILPGLEAHMPFDPIDVPLVIVGGGRRPSLHWMREFFPGKKIWCADSGLIPCFAAGFSPSRVIGDGDSTPRELWNSIRNTDILIEEHPADKDYTDLQLALFRAGEEKRHSTAIVTGCWGGRFDHLWTSVHSALWALERGVRVLAFADHREALFLLHGGEEWEIHTDRKKGLVLSLLPLGGDCSGVTVKNVQWPLTDVRLYQRKPFSVSNRLLGEKSPRIAVKEGVLGAYIGWESKSGLFI